jgi:hypothetical protein
MTDLQKDTPYYEAFRRAKPLSFVDYEKFEKMLSDIIEIINLIATEEKIKDFNKISDILKSLESKNIIIKHNWQDNSLLAKKNNSLLTIFGTEENGVITKYAVML